MLCSLSCVATKDTETSEKGNSENEQKFPNDQEVSKVG